MTYFTPEFFEGFTAKFANYYTEWDDDRAALHLMTSMLGEYSELLNIDETVALKAKDGAAVSRELITRELSLELGDMLWYSAYFCSRFGISFTGVVDQVDALMSKADSEFPGDLYYLGTELLRHFKIRTFACIDISEIMDTRRTGIRMIGIGAGRLAEVIKKHTRGDKIRKGALLSMHAFSMELHVSLIVCGAVYACRTRKLDLSTIFEMNVDKIRRRISEGYYSTKNAPTFVGDTCRNCGSEFRDKAQSASMDGMCLDCTNSFELFHQNENCKDE